MDFLAGISIVIVGAVVLVVAAGFGMLAAWLLVTLVNLRNRSRVSER